MFTHVTLQNQIGAERSEYESENESETSDDEYGAESSDYEYETETVDYEKYVFSSSLFAE